MAMSPFVRDSPNRATSRCREISARRSSSAVSSGTAWSRPLIPTSLSRRGGSDRTLQSAAGADGPACSAVSRTRRLPPAEYAVFAD